MRKIGKTINSIDFAMVSLYFKYAKTFFLRKKYDVAIEINFYLDSKTYLDFKIPNRLFFPEYNISMS